MAPDFTNLDLFRIESLALITREQQPILICTEPIKDAMEFLENVCVNHFSSILSDKHNMRVKVSSLRQLCEPSIFLLTKLRNHLCLDRF